MDYNNIRWVLRFRNFEKAYLALQDAVEQPNLNDLERNGLIQRFEYTIELAWKVIKDFLEDKGFAFKPSPKDTIRQAQQAGYIQDAQELIDALTLRNELSHTYDEALFEQAEVQIRNTFFPALRQLYTIFKSELV